ncbi:hypothetical protein OC846_002524 [Tilletia horrida]|uniref:LysM domain-containing protein n=1 Tax=Tilletia horrida TaxID=155126 RepID=A0AAN6GWT7_9BASI|nr:hypothetical protein OC846_002524 [Tilletia horrida]KAK0554114.1 hypothetical protein OC845_000928 [Tilletia horrida]KAK0568156.1 hypothetical protein OC861_002247 [Tilletia horrida]
MRFTSHKQQQQQQRRRTSTVSLAALALASVFLFSSASVAAAAAQDTGALARDPDLHHQRHHAAAHNAVHAAHVHHSSAPASSASTTTEKHHKKLGAPSSLPKSKSHSSKSAAVAAGSNQLGAHMREADDGSSKLYSVGDKATELVGSGTDTLYLSNATACARHYTVQDTDTCDIIGHKTHTSTYQIMALNIDKTGPYCYGLETGMRLCLGRFGSDCQLVHRVRNDESCTDILQKYDLSRRVLMENNPNLDCGNIYNGLNLCVAPGRIAPPEPHGLYVARRSVKEEL